MLAVVVPVNNDEEFEGNIIASPGLREIGAGIVPCRNASSAAEAFETGCKRTDAPWIIFCHQDVFFPHVSGALIENIVSGIQEAQASRVIIGFCGLGPEPAGTVNDRGKLLDWPASDSATSIDELCVIMHRDCVYKIDPNLGWDLWGTDLCLQAQADGHPARIVRVLLHHNSMLCGLGEAFAASAAVLKKKWPGKKLNSLNGMG